MGFTTITFINITFAVLSLQNRFVHVNLNENLVFVLSLIFSIEVSTEGATQIQVVPTLAGFLV